MVCNFFSKRYPADIALLGMRNMTQMDLTDVYTAFHPNTTEYTFFSAPHGNKIDHIPGHKKSLNIYKKKEEGEENDK